MIDFSLPEFLNDQRSLLYFFIVTVVLGGGAAALAGHATAKTWRPWWKVVLFMLLLGIGVRFIHHVIFSSPFLSLHYYLVDASVCLIFGLLSYRMKRVGQMTCCYNWLNERSGLLNWRQRAHGVAGRAESG